MLRSLAVTCVIWLTTLGCGAPSFPRSSAHPLLGQQLPELGQHTTVFGATFDADALRGRPAFVKFFAEYCLPCKESLPGFQRLGQTHRHIRFVGVSEDANAEPGAELARTFGLTFPVINDEGKVLSQKFEVETLPTSFAADSSGIIRWVGTSRQSERDLKRAVAALR